MFQLKAGYLRLVVDLGCVYVPLPLGSFIVLMLKSSINKCIKILIKITMAEVADIKAIVKEADMALAEGPKDEMVVDQDLDLLSNST